MIKIVGFHSGCSGEVMYVRYPNGARFFYCDGCRLSTRKGANIEIDHFLH